MAKRDPGRAARILVVDDDDLVREHFHRALTRKDYQVSVARSGEEGLHFLEEYENEGTPYDLVLLDLVMEGMGGIGFLYALHHRRRRPRVVVMSGRMTTADTVEAMRLGAEGVLDKPTRLETLLPEIERVLALTTDPLVIDLRSNPGKMGGREEVAQRFKVAPATVSNRLRRLTGRSYRAFIHECRVEEAKRLLAETELEAKEIAARLGFRSYRAFARVFKQCTGSAPREYRRKSRPDRLAGEDKYTSEGEPREM